MIPSYGKIYNLGKPEVDHIFSGPVVVQEKIDGSQFSFMKTEDGRLLFRSKSRMVAADEEAGLFGPAIRGITERMGLLPGGIVCRGEVLAKPKHNVLAYDRVPRGHFILFDVERGAGSLEEWGALLDLEVVPRFSVDVQSREDIERLLETVSCLGGQKIEGLVFKNYAMYDPRGEGILKAKYVAPLFREMHGEEWKTKDGLKALEAGSGQAVLDGLVDRYSSSARFHKAVQHLTEDGKITHSPRDIGPLLGEVARDIHEECEEEMKEILWKWAWKRVSKRITGKVPSWYKEQLLRRQFDE